MNKRFEIIRNLFWSTVVCIIPQVNYAQTTDGGFSQIVEKTTPISPQAKEFEKFGTFQVDYSTGLPNIEIPIYTISIGGFSLPVSLKYHASGIKVQDISSPVGIGWMLSAGGSITREKKGTLDSFHGVSNVPRYYTEALLSEISNRNECFFWKALADGMGEDTETDKYIYSFPGHSGSFRYSLPDMSVKTLPYEPIVIEEIKDSYEPCYKIVDTEGNQMYFCRTEKGSHSDNESMNIYSWYLTKIVLASLNDSIVLEYEESAPTLSSTWNTFKTTGNTVNIPGAPCPLGGPEDKSSFSYNRSQNFNLALIKWQGNKIQFKYIKDREDHKNPYYVDKNSRLSEIIVLNMLGDTIQHVALCQNYSGYQPMSKRMLLEKVSFLGSNTSQAESYLFEYDSTELPCYSHSMQASFDNKCHEDYWGYYNGTSSNNWIPQEYLPNSLSTAYGTNRNAREQYAKALSLKKITFPSGGSSEFEFESNKNEDGTILYGGLRVKSIINRQSDGTLSTRKHYLYNGASCAVNICQDLYGYLEPYLYTWQEQRTLPSIRGYQLCKQVYLGNPLVSLSGNEGAPVHYTTVYEYDGSLSNYSRKTKYEYNCYAPDIDYLLDSDPHSADLPLSKWDRNYNYDYGNLQWLLTRKQILDSKDSVCYEEEYNYDTNVIDVCRAGLRIERAFVHYALDQDTEGIEYYSYLSPSDVFIIPTVCLLSSKRETYDGVSVTTNYTYDPAYNTLEPLRIDKVDNRGRCIMSTILGYPFQNREQYMGLLTSNIQVPVYKSVLEAGVLIWQEKYDYESINGKWKKTALYYSKDNTLRKRHVYTYDHYGNLSGITKDSIEKISYIWGYNGSSVISKIEGISIADVKRLLQSADISIEDLTTNHSLFTENDSVIRSIIHDSGGLITSYAYKPLIGLTSETSPNGIVQTYEYDGFNRLSRTFDSNGDDISNNIYHVNQHLER